MMEKEYRQSALESIARRTLKAYDLRILNGSPAAVPVEKIAEWLGLTLVYLCLRKTGHILGETAFDDQPVPIYDREEKQYKLIRVKRGTVMIDDSLLGMGTDGRLRFTVAHEIAHWLIHQEIFTDSLYPAALVNPATSSQADTKTERQANMLATALLLPVGQVKKAFHDLRGQSADIQASLAGLFGVSQQAMGIFMREHRLP